MERFKSTIGTTATIVLGLVVAAHLRNGAYQEPAQTPWAAGVAVGTWKDLPPSDVRHRGTAPIGTTPAAILAVAGPMLPGSVAAILPAELAAPGQPRKDAATFGYGTTRYGARVRQASGTVGKDTEAMLRGGPTGPAVDDDPIGALIRDLDAARRS